MDYSSSIHDAENPAGASPWGTSPVPSPHHARISSYQAHGDVPPSPTPYSTQSSTASYGPEDTIGSGPYDRPDSSAGTESVADNDGRRPDTAESARSQETQHPPTYNGPQQQQGHPPQQRHESQRYHQGARHIQQQPAAQHYKLLATITGLERTGRKDPILRFNVQVGSILAFISMA